MVARDHGIPMVSLTAVNLPCRALFFLFGTKNMVRVKLMATVFKKNQNAPRPSEHPPVRGEKCQNV